MADQLLREWPPGYGGVERVAHELAAVSCGTVWSFDVQKQSNVDHDSLSVPYLRLRLPCFRPFGRLFLPLPSTKALQLLTSSTPLHGHLPSPGVLLLLILARLFRPCRQVTVHWHCFLESGPGFIGLMFSLYQWIALRFLPYFSFVVTTSPVLYDELLKEGCPQDQVFVLPCCLSDYLERAALNLPPRSLLVERPLRVLFIGRLDSYKRIDWLLQALSLVHAPWKIIVVGDGPKRLYFESVATRLFGFPIPSNVVFRGRLSESEKLYELSVADLLVLPSDTSNEAFGIVQLEAMASGIPSLAFHSDRSGMGWVGKLPDLDWEQTSSALPFVLQRLALDSSLLMRLGAQSRQRYCSMFARSVWLQKLRSLRLLNSSL